MRIVEFSSGKYAIRKWFFLYKDISRSGVGYWWSSQSQYFEDCLGTLEEVVAYYDKHFHFVKTNKVITIDKAKKLLEEKKKKEDSETKEGA